MLTLFTTPKPFRGIFATIQLNALRSWTLLRPWCEIILFGDEEGSAEVARELDILNVQDISRSEFGMPLLDGLFNQAKQCASNELLCFVNADIILMSDFRRAVEQIARCRNRFLMVGQRWNIDLNEPLVFETNWEARLRNFVILNGELYPGIDYFVYPRNLWGDVPPLVVGRVHYDNWPLYGARFRKAPVIDTTEAVMAVHQNHNHSHTQGTQHLSGTLEAQRNLEILGGHCNRFTTREATHQLTAQGLKVRCRNCYPICVCSSDFCR